jgi:hypothetical protein
MSPVRFGHASAQKHGAKKDFTSLDFWSFLCVAFFCLFDPIAAVGQSLVNTDENSPKFGHEIFSQRATRSLACFWRPLELQKHSLESGDPFSKSERISCLVVWFGAVAMVSPQQTITLTLKQLGFSLPDCCSSTSRYLL